jgi:hypothetical protein
MSRFGATKGLLFNLAALPHQRVCGGTAFVGVASLCKTLHLRALRLWGWELCRAKTHALRCEFAVRRWGLRKGGLQVFDAELHIGVMPGGLELAADKVGVN